MIPKPISRRNFLLGAASLMAPLLAACKGPLHSSAKAPVTAPALPTQGKASAAPPTMPTQASTPSPTPAPSPTPTPTPSPKVVSVWVDPAMPEAFKATAGQIVTQLSTAQAPETSQVQPADSAGQADLTISSSTSPSDSGKSRVIARANLVPVCSPRTPVRSVNAEQVTALLNGSATDWNAVGSPTSIKVEPFVIGGLSMPGSAAGAITVATFDDFVAQLADHPGAVALAPVDDVDFRSGCLTLGDVDLLAEPEPPSDWPLVVELSISGSADAWPLVEALNLPPATDPAGSTVPPLTVSWVGDVILGRTVHTIMTRLHDYQAPFRLVAPELKKADLTIADLECSLSDNITPPTDPYTFLFMTFTAAADGLSLSGVDAVSQANNHSMNFGAEGMRDTLAALDKRNILHFGIGENLAEARKPIVFDTKGRKLILLGYDGITATTYGATDSTPGTAPLDVDLMTADIQAARPNADLVIPFIHWGIEYQLVPSDEQRAIARAAIDAGADMVVGSHCHWVQGMEIYQGKPIVYSLANFVFDQDWSLETKQGLIMHLVFRQNRLAAMRFVPVLIEDFYQPHIVDGTDMTQILDRIWQSTDIMLSSQ